MSDVRLNPNEVKVLAALASLGNDGFGYMPFVSIGERVRLSRREVRLACRSLTRKGLAKFGRGLWTEGGEPAGSGYAATDLGVTRADKKLVEKIERRFWD